MIFEVFHFSTKKKNMVSIFDHFSVEKNANLA
jgi:hypothetical protein